MQFSLTMFATLTFVLSTMFSSSFPDNGPEPTQEAPEGAPRELEGVRPRKTWDEAWRGFFGRDIPDPITPPDVSSEEWQRQREQADRHAELGAEFTQAATSVVTAGTPSPTAAAGIATQAIGETAQGIVEAETTPTPEQPGVLRRVWNWVTSWFD